MDPIDAEFQQLVAEHEAEHLRYPAAPSLLATSGPELSTEDQDLYEAAWGRQEVAL